MNRHQGFFQRPFVSALFGGAIVAVVGLVAIATGLVNSGGGSTTTVQAPLSSPVVSKSSDESGGDESSNTVNEIYKADGNGVAFVESQLEPEEAEENPFNPFGEPEEGSGGGVATGSGFVVDDEGHILTNNHVVEGASKVTVKLGASDTVHDAEVVGTDPSSDLALLKVDADAKELHPLTLGDSSATEVGDPVVAIGNPFGLDRTVTAGIVSALQRQIQAPDGFSISNVIQTDAAINPGNSGGPLINGEGEVIGINSQIETGGSGSEGNVGIGFAIPINTAKSEIQTLIQNGEVEHAYLGISGTPVTPEAAADFNLPVEEGVILQEVVKGGPADKAGLHGADKTATIEGIEVALGGDIVTEINGQKIKSMEEVIALVEEAEPGDKFQVTYLRDGKSSKATITLGTRPSSAEEPSQSSGG
jgi:S1-C subfamily serine protease